MADIVFQDGGPISSTQLQNLVTLIHQVDAKTTQFPNQFGSLVNASIAQKMVAGVFNAGSPNLATSYKEIAVTFEPPLTSDPATIQITLEAGSSDYDIVSFIKAGTAKAGGVTVVLDRVKSATGKDITTPIPVKIHYFAVAKTS